MERSTSFVGGRRPTLILRGKPSSRSWYLYHGRLNFVPTQNLRRSGEQRPPGPPSQPWRPPLPSGREIRLPPPPEAPSAPRPTSPTTSTPRPEKNPTSNGPGEPEQPPPLRLRPRLLRRSPWRPILPYGREISPVPPPEAPSEPRPIRPTVPTSRPAENPGSNNLRLKQ